MYKIAVMGAYDSIYGFASVGLDIYPISSTEEGIHTIRELTDGRYAVIYITEALAADLSKEIDKYREQYLPAIILIPGISGNTGEGIKSVSRSVEQAVGSDILFQSES